MNIVKKQGIGTYLTLAAIVLTLIASIIYGVALKTGMDLIPTNGGQPFYETGRVEDAAMMSSVVTCSVLALVFLVAAIALSQFKFEGIVGTVCNFVVGALRVVAPALILVALLNFVYGSLTGLGWTFFSNAELAIEPQAITAGNQVITGCVFFGIAAVAGVVAAFFGMVKKED